MEEVSETFAKIIANDGSYYTSNGVNLLSKRLVKFPEEIRCKVAEKIGDILKQKIAGTKGELKNCIKDCMGAAYLFAFDGYKSLEDYEGMIRIGDIAFSLGKDGDAIEFYESVGGKLDSYRRMIVEQFKEDEERSERLPRF